ncbi:hypothetical protein BC332_26082 [Capsicum chinense]|nr:hypothetical protein BC332_26082 [Capsicum chinense]
MMDGKGMLGSPKTRVERALERNGLLRIPVQKLGQRRRLKLRAIQIFLIYRECTKMLNRDGVLDITVPPTRKNAWDWSARATSAYPKNTSPVADDDKVGGHDIEGNELEKHDTDDDKGFVKDNFMITKF